MRRTNHLFKHENFILQLYCKRFEINDINELLEFDTVMAGD
jgi:hypothetical protein